MFHLPGYVEGRSFCDADSNTECGPPPDEPAEDDFKTIRRFFDACNERWKAILTPGYLLCVDESMFRWLAAERMPGWMKVGRNPDSIGHELKTLACVLSRIMFRMELHEGKTFDNNKKYVKEFGAQTAQTLRASA